MSFSKDTKTQLCRAELFTDEQRTAMVYGMVLFSRQFGPGVLSLTTECRQAAMTYTEMLSAVTGVIVEMSVNLTRWGGEKALFNISVPDKNDCRRLFDQFGCAPGQPSLRINRANIDSEQCLPAFLRGVFISCGNVTDPDKDYHLEMVVPHKNLASDLERIISEVDELGIRPHIINRKGSYILYIKGSEEIADFLTYIGAQMSALSIMQSKMIKSVRNDINRRINSETANSNKTAKASAKQIQAIKRIQKSPGGFDLLPDELRELAALRLENPECSLRELGELLHPPISRSGVNHRLQKLMDIAEAPDQSNT